jgi:hypothetical protein
LTAGAPQVSDPRSTHTTDRRAHPPRRGNDRDDRPAAPPVPDQPAAQARKGFVRKRVKWATKRRKGRTRVWKTRWVLVKAKGRARA